MAIVNSVFMGLARNSAGNGTFRTVRGRTIASQKISKRGAVAGNLSKNQFALAVISRYASLHAADINVSFDPTTYGSARNAFFKLNYDALKAAVSALYTASLQTGAAKFPTDSELESAIASYAQSNPSAIYRVKRAGYEVVYLSGEWSSDDNPEAADQIGGKVKITVLAEPSDGGTVTGGGSYVPGTTVTLTATKNSGYAFGGWSDGVSTASRTITVGETAATYTAQFNEEFT